MISWICEVGSNHNANLGRALELVRAARLIGCSAVKFQLFNNEIGKPLREWLPIEILPALRDEAHKYNLQFGCSPFYLKAVEELEPYVDFYKLTSNYDMVHKLFYACLDTGKPVICSFPPYELKPSDAKYFTKSAHVLAAIPLYPTPLSEVHLNQIPFNTVIDGWSDHTHNAGVIYRAIHHYNIKVVEFHLDLDGHGWEYHYGHCWLPNEIKQVIDTVKQGLEVD